MRRKCLWLSVLFRNGVLTSLEPHSSFTWITRPLKTLILSETWANIRLDGWNLCHSMTARLSMSGGMRTVLQMPCPTLHSRLNHLHLYLTPLTTLAALVSTGSFTCAHILTDLVAIYKPPPAITSTFSISMDEDLLSTIHTRYTDDPWCVHIKASLFLPYGIQEQDRLLYAGDCLIVPWTSHVRESLFHLAHDVLSHFGFSKSYGLLWHIMT